MNGTCRKCAAPLKKGNIKVIRPRGKKRPYRIHRKCPPSKVTSTPMVCQHCPDIKECLTQVPGEGKCLRIPAWKNPPIAIEGTTGSPLQRPQDTTDGPVTVEGVFHYSPPPRFRYFMTREQAERVRAAVERNVAFGLGVAFEVFPVPEDQVDNEPDRFDDLVEVKVNWKVE